MRINHRLSGSFNGLLRRRHSLSLPLTPRSRLVSDKHNADSMTKCMRIKTLHSVLNLLKQNIPVWRQRQHEAATHTLCVCERRACCVLPYGASWGLGILGEWRGSALTFDAELKGKAANADCFHHCSSG